KVVGTILRRDFIGTVFRLEMCQFVTLTLMPSHTNGELWILINPLSVIEPWGIQLQSNVAYFYCIDLIPG
ncbi:MAG: hypothetical protein VKJ64_16050, partial [Leptolyngbyaceae bacterium]|nr:hypothetical protein [Leptolyngbyaceae bacterium]